MRYLILFFLVSACGNKSTSSAIESASQGCDQLNQKYVGYTKDQLLGQSKDASGAAAVAGNEYYTNLYQKQSLELLKASECSRR